MNILRPICLHSPLCQNKHTNHPSNHPGEENTEIASEVILCSKNYRSCGLNLCEYLAIFLMRPRRLTNRVEEWESVSVLIEGRNNFKTCKGARDINNDPWNVSFSFQLNNYDLQKLKK
jgi:hypothetical protein